MPINMVTEDERLNIIGKIRLGVKKISQKGNEYPDNVDYFVLKDAPDVEEYYGDKPNEIHGFFIVDDIDKVTPHWLKLYGAGVKNKDGTRTPGKLKCHGDGPHMDGSPGVATHWDKKNRDTGIVPERACLGPECPDFKDSRGNQQCKWSMQVLLWMPHCNKTGLYQIDTTSKIVIGRFQSALRTISKSNGGKIKGYPFRLWRDQTTIVLPDGSKKAVNVMDIEVYPKFAEKYGDIQLQTDKFNASNILGVSHRELLMAPMEDNWPTIEEGSIQQGTKQLNASENIDSVANKVLQDPEIIALFKQLETVKGSPFTEKAKRTAVLKKINEPDIKASVMEALNAGIAAGSSGKKETTKKETATVITQTVDAEVINEDPVNEEPAIMQEEPPPPEEDDAGGIL